MILGLIAGAVSLGGLCTCLSKISMGTIPSIASFIAVKYPYKSLFPRNVFVWLSKRLSPLFETSSDSCQKKTWTVMHFKSRQNIEFGMGVWMNFLLNTQCICVLEVTAMSQGSRGMLECHFPTPAFHPPRSLLLSNCKQRKNVGESMSQPWQHGWSQWALVLVGISQGRKGMAPISHKMALFSWGEMRHDYLVWLCKMHKDNETKTVQ